MLRSVILMMLLVVVVSTSAATSIDTPAAANTPADKVARELAAGEVLQAINVDRTVKPMALRMAGFIAEQIAQWNITPAQQPDVNVAMTKIQDLLINEMSWRSVAKDYIGVYTESFTTDELRNIAAFFKTPTGKKYIATVPALQEKALVIGEQHLAAIQPQIQLILEDLQRHLLATAPHGAHPTTPAKASDASSASSPEAKRADALLNAEQGGQTP